MIHDALSTTMQDLQMTISRALERNRALVFNKDLFLKIPLAKDFTTIQQNRQLQIDRNLENGNNC